jgi:type I restriction enzyme S subunit
MSFPRYPAYKPSGVEWLGEVPEHWEILAIKRLASLQSGTGITSDSILDDGPYPVFGGNGVRGFSESFTHEGNYPIIGRQGALCGNINYASGRFWASEHAVVASPANQCEFRWLGEMLRAMNLNQHSTSAAQPGLSVEMVSALLAARPPRDEQLAIATFLDHETAKIDALIAEQQRLIELLQEKRQAVISHAVTKGLNPNVPMKDSGVEWLGEVPEHWEVKRLKHLLSEPLSYGANEPAESVQLDDPRYIRITDIKDDGSLNPETFRSLSQEKASDYLLEDKDILLARSGATVGKSFMYRSDMGPCCFAGYLILARCSPVDMTPEWVYLFSESAAYWNQIRSDAIQATIQNVSAEKYGNMLLPIPPSSEMQAVIAVARQKADQYAQLIKAADDLIELMGERRAALISAAVTGQIDVRGLVEAEAGVQ